MENKGYTGELTCQPYETPKQSLYPPLPEHFANGCKRRYDTMYELKKGSITCTTR